MTAGGIHDDAAYAAGWEMCAHGYVIVLHSEQPYEGWIYLLFARQPDLDQMLP